MAERGHGVVPLFRQARSDGVQRHMLVARIGDGAADEGHDDERQLADLEAPKQRRVEKCAANHVAEHGCELAHERHHDDDLGDPLDTARDVTMRGFHAGFDSL